MKLFLDTTTDTFAIALYDKKFNLIDSYILDKEPKKVNLITDYTKKILAKNDIKITDITDFYTNLGPGYFTGVRISLVYLRTIALLTNAKIYTTSSMQIIQKQNPNHNKFTINASGGKSYVFYPNNTDFSIDLVKIEVSTTDNFDSINYHDLINNLENYLNIFSNNENLLNIEPYYIKQPQIGEKK
ncbi:tRNA (adenosine(37)-N6)-threonylcarbamoyltransferase complex dimerization subunit type 1 TsaB [Mycoplasma zalophidermidis]|uniref:tRNA (adenosine(37)-N6)-threonylcarbamoyltransferase complex dimerization subunit type 1 TsaB n=1 Tax=Mycoplasma zalophidermidis TaxID=398174 RepID=UPI001C0FA086|nr:tRNA (adenosine(37)-N6)-threonylcarbamoyltransferase complex dimerization subunit type 1 TsaB [Mycoplasma zalophidermidis]MBU4690064.1 tRNA (adenosine(37)-N6)-threonylcarbamoyltransferase complex dimerization subunit type 1 TsaB [Mycoplasma zalophidermidis]MCR8966833.1 tRNA (adenosine(37)-N6)-threonylcarbamoyltransferase complex dimerization subunit type 1 TsaB [Mycoplasma zalophidermidis]